MIITIENIDQDLIDNLHKVNEETLATIDASYIPDDNITIDFEKIMTMDRNGSVAGILSKLTSSAVILRGIQNVIEE